MRTTSMTTTRPVGRSPCSRALRTWWPRSATIWPTSRSAHKSPECIDVCLHAVRRHHPDSRIIVADCASLRDQYVGARQACERHKAELRTGWLRHGHTGQLEYLLSLADTEVAVFLDQDCVLLRSLTPLFDHLRQGKLLVGPRDFMTLDHPRFVSRFPQL